MKPRNWLTLSYEGLRAELNEIVERYRAHFGRISPDVPS